jgi:predicted subunit of tRNA(5-methylaminomethyl-2-thiouridylate) methyltransferase
MKNIIDKKVFQSLRDRERIVYLLNFTGFTKEQIAKLNNWNIKAVENILTYIGEKKCSID